MTAFDDLRKKVLQQGALSLFGETVELSDQNGTHELTVKIETRQAAPKNQSTGTDSHSRAATGTVDQTEQVRVTIDKSAIAYALRVGSKMTRTIDNTDDRPFVFAGEIEFNGPVHAVYVFQRPLRVSQGRRV